MAGAYRSAICVLVVLATLYLIAPQRASRRIASFDSLGALLVTGGMLLLVYALVKAPDQGWGSSHTIIELALAAMRWERAQLALRSRASGEGGRASARTSAKRSWYGTASGCW